jgi:hypothetical protein
MIKAGGRKIHLKIWQLINSIWNMEELPQLWKESNILPINRKGYKKYCSNYCGISVLTTTLKNVPNILLPS